MGYVPFLHFYWFFFLTCRKSRTASQAASICHAICSFFNAVESLLRGNGMCVWEGGSWQLSKGQGKLMGIVGCSIVARAWALHREGPGPDHPWGQLRPASHLRELVGSNQLCPTCLHCFSSSFHCLAWIRGTERKKKYGGVCWARWEVGTSSSNGGGSIWHATSRIRRSWASPEEAPVFAPGISMWCWKDFFLKSWIAAAQSLFGQCTGPRADFKPMWLMPWHQTPGLRGPCSSGLTPLFLLPDRSFTWSAFPL